VNLGAGKTGGDTSRIFSTWSNPKHI